MLSERIKAARKALGLTQQQLADRMGITLQRVKHLSRGDVQALTRQEALTLVEMGVSDSFLRDGTGDVLQSESERELQKRLLALKISREQVVPLCLPKRQGSQLGALLFAVRLQDADLVKKTLEEMQSGTVLTDIEQSAIDLINSLPLEHQNELLGIMRLFLTTKKSQI